MSNIRLRRFGSSEQGGWELDCIVLPNDEMNGELVDYRTRKAVDFRELFKSGLYAALDGLLDRVVVSEQIPREQVRLVIGRLRDEGRQHFSFGPPGQYEPSSTEMQIWALVDEVYQERIGEIS